MRHCPRLRWPQTTPCGILRCLRHHRSCEGGRTMSPRRRGGRIQPTDDWEQLELFCAWPEQVRYEESRPMVLFGVSAAERSRQTRSASERTLYRRTERFDE